MQAVVTDKQAKRYIANNVSAFLSERGMTQQDLADATGETKMTISRVVRGIHVPSAAILARIAEALNASVDALLSPPAESSKKSA